MKKILLSWFLLLTFFVSNAQVPKPTKINPAVCGTVLNTSTGDIGAGKTKPAASGYRFRFTRGTIVQTRDEVGGNVQISRLPDYAYNTKYTVDVSVLHEGVWGAYGVACEVTTSAPFTQLALNVCGTVLNEDGDIHADMAPYAAAYRFRIKNGDNEQFLESETVNAKLSDLSDYAGNTTYTIDVAVKVDDEWSDYGVACNVKTRAVPPKISADVCGKTLEDMNSIIYADHVDQATAYRFRLTQGGHEQILEIEEDSFRMVHLSSYAYNTTYSIDVAVKVDDMWSDYGPACSVSTPAPITKIAADLCGATLEYIYSDIRSDEPPLATAYRFRVTQDGHEQIIDREMANFRLTDLESYTYNTTYSIEVAVQVNDVWSEYGQACNVTTPAAVALISAESCGSTLGDINSEVYADHVAQATMYRFRIRQGGHEQTYDTEEEVFRFIHFSAYAYNTTYTVDVAVQVNDVWSDYGPTCEVTTPGPVSQLTAEFCGKTLERINSAILSDQPPLVSGYRFRIRQGGREQFYENLTPVFLLSHLEYYAYNTTYSVDVSVKVGDVWSDYGPSCEVTTPEAPEVTVSSVGVPANGTYTSGQNLDFTVNFSRTVLVNTAGGTPQIPLTVGDQAVYADYISGSGDASLVFRYTVQSGHLDIDGIQTSSAIQLNGATIEGRLDHMSATLTLNNVAALTDVKVGVIPVATATPASATICSGTATNVALTSVPTGASFVWTAATASGTVNGALASSGTSIIQTLTGNGIINYTVTPTLNGIIGSPVTVAVTVSQVKVTPSQTDVSCYGESNGSATVNVTGGRGAYTYAWSPSGGSAATASGLVAGTYTVTVKDANLCQTTQSFIITGPSAALSASISGNNVTAAGAGNGSATVVPSGGTAPYTYSWSPSGGIAATATGLSAGVYTVTVTDFNGCQTTKSVTVYEPSTLSGFAAINKTYGAAPFALTAPTSNSTGAVTYSSNNNSVATILGSQVTITGAGQATITATQAASGNYLQNTISLTLTIAKKALTVVNTSRNKVYGQVLTNTDFTGSISGLENNDVITVTRGSVGAGSNATVATYAIIGTLADPGSKLGNYTVSNAEGQLKVTPKALAVINDDRDKVYGQAFSNIDFTGHITGIENNDNITVTRSSTGSVATATVAAGPYPIVATLVDPSSKLGNYTVSNPNGQLRVIPKALTVTNTNRSKAYGQVLTNTDFSGTITGLVNNDNITVTRNSAGSVATATVAAGPYPIIGTLVDPSSKLGNYTISNPNGELMVTAKTLTVVNTSRSKVYGQLLSNTDFTGSISGVEPGDNITVTRSSTGASATATVAGSPYPIVATIVDPAGKLGNYVLSNTIGQLTVNRKGLLITAEDKERFAGAANPAFTASYSGFENNETAAVLTSPVAFNTDATVNSVPGNYDIIASGAVAANYNISYQKGKLTVKAGAPTDIVLAATSLYENRPAGTSAGTLSSSSLDPSATFTYSLVTGTGSTDNASFSIDGNTVKTTSVLDYEQKQSFSIRVKSTTQFGLSLEKAISINLQDVNEVPTLAAITDQSICYTSAQQTIALTGISGGPETAQTTTLGVSSSNDNLFESLSVIKAGANAGTLTYKLKAGAAGSATVMVVVQDNGGTANTGTDSFGRTFTVTANALPVATISSDLGTSISRGETIKLTATGGVSYVWSSASGVISGQNTAVLTVRPDKETTYTVTTTNASGCSSSQSITIMVKEEFAKIEGTNIMSPNGDGKNDYWVIKNIDLYPTATVKIFDRAGRVIYQKTGYDNSWDARLDGNPLAEGTYFYVIDFGRERRNQFGFITIIRESSR